MKTVLKIERYAQRLTQGYMGDEGFIREKRFVVIFFVDLWKNHKELPGGGHFVHFT